MIVAQDDCVDHVNVCSERRRDRDKDGDKGGGETRNSNGSWSGMFAGRGTKEVDELETLHHPVRLLWRCRSWGEAGG